MEDYEKKYKDALKRASAMIDVADNQEDVYNCALTIFPELVENKDEKIRNNCIHFLELQKQHHASTFEIEECIAWLKKQKSVAETVTKCKDSWYNDGKIAGQAEGLTADEKYWQGWHDALEKQGEQKPVDKVEPKFHEGDIIKPKNDNCPYCQIIQVDVSDRKYRFDDGYVINFSQEDAFELVERKPVDKTKPKFHVGDWILYSGDHYEGVRHITKIDENGYYIERNGLPHGIIPFNHEICMRLWTIQDAKDGDILVNGSNIFIFHFINDTRLMGYCHINMDDERFYDDTGKNECFCLIDAIVYPATKEQRYLLFKKMNEAGYRWDDEKKLNPINEYNGEDYGIDGLYHAQAILERTLGEVIGYQSDDGILEHKCAINAVKRLYNKKNYWNEDDEKNLQGVIDEIQANKSNAPECDVKTYDKFLSWLKSIKDRVQPQLKQKWTEEDEMNWKNAIEAASRCYGHRSQCFDWIRSVKKMLS